MKKVILEEIENMKYLLGYKRGVVISEQEVEKDDMIDKYSSKSISNSINSGNYGNLDPKVADVIKQAQNALGGQSVLTNPTTGAPTTGAPAAGAQAAGATTPPASTAPVTPIKIGVKYPDIETLQNLLKTKFQADLTSDGKYGPKTSASILAALQKLPTPTTNDVKTDNTQVKDTDSEAIKKAAETNAGVATGGTNPSATAGGTNTGAATGGAGGNYSEIGLEDLMGQPSDNKPVAGTTQPVAGTTQPVAGTTQPVAGTTQPTTEKR
jgi:hypothetical protein